jgi:hypothetical protein
MTNSFKILIICGLLLSGCSRQQKDVAVIEGEFQNCSGEKITLLELDTKSITRLDSLVMDASGRFRFILKMQEPGFYMIQSKLGKVLVLFMEVGDTVNLSGDFGSFPDRIALKGSKEAEVLEEFFIFTRKNERKVDSLEMLLVEKQDSAGYYGLTLRIDTAFRDIWNIQRDCEKAFIDRNPASLVSLIVLNYSFGLSTVLSPDEDFPYYHKLDSTLMERYPGNKHVQYHHLRMMEFQREQEMKKGKKL